MKCFHCINVVCHTEYPPNAIVSVCPRCLWRSKEQQIPSKIPPVQAVSLVNQSESNIFDDIYINNEVRVESMTQKRWSLECGEDICPDKSKYGSLIYSIECKVCMENKIERMKSMGVWE